MSSMFTQFLAPHADAFAFGLLGLSVSWTLSDAVFANLPTFMRCLPSGLYIPDQIGISATVTQAVGLMVWFGITGGCGYRPRFNDYVKFIWSCLAVELGGALLIAFGWTAVIGGQPVLLLTVESVAALIGALSWAATTSTASSRCVGSELGTARLLVRRASSSSSHV